MSEEQNKRLYDHYTELINGKIKTSNPTRDALIVSDAKKHLADLIAKNPNLVPEEDPTPKPKPTNSKKAEVK